MLKRCGRLANGSHFRTRRFRNRSKEKNRKRNKSLAQQGFGGTRNSEATAKRLVGIKFPEGVNRVVKEGGWWGLKNEYFGNR